MKMNVATVVSVVVIFILVTLSSTGVEGATPEVCPDNEEYVDCVRPLACAITCAQPYYFDCPLDNIVCLPGCECKSGYVRTEPKGSCVPRTECADYCGPNQKFLGCGSACPITCADRNPNCITVCFSGCFCTEKYILNSLIGGQCILQTDCPSPH